MDKMTSWWDAETLSTSTSWGTWEGKRMVPPVPSLLEGLAWVGGLIPELVALGGAELQDTNPWRQQDHGWVFISHARLFDLYMPGALSATMAAPAHHGCFQHPAPGGAVPTSRRAWQCQAAFAGHVGVTHRQRLCPERGHLMAVWQRVAAGLRRGLSGQG